MGRLTPHVLDTARSVPRGDFKVELYAIDGERRRRLRDINTNADDRYDDSLLEGDEFVAGVYKLIFHAGEYFLDSSARIPYEDSSSHG